MRIVHILSALTGAAAFILLAASHHGGNDNANAILAALAQVSAATAGLAMARHRLSRLSAAAAYTLLAGANLFAASLYAGIYFAETPFGLLAPLGGGALIIGWLLLAFAQPASE
jgi:uncharacterized membrane protein YgdD (TMEM256/DUF423 family)